MRPLFSLVVALFVALASSSLACGDDTTSEASDAGATPPNLDTFAPDAASGANDAASDVFDKGAADAAHEASVDAASPIATHVITAEQATGQVMVFDYAVADWSSASAVVWTWTPPDSSFSNLSDVKYSKDGKRLLVAASGGGIAVIDIATKNVLFKASPGGNTHAIEELPDGNVVSASSDGAFLKVFSPAGALLQTVTFASAHGVYWDAARKRLWAGGGSFVKAFTYASGALLAVGSWSVPGGDAHDLFPAAQSDDLFVSAAAGVFLFDRQALDFSAYASGPNRTAVKAVGRNPGSSTVCLIRATNAPGPVVRSWSTDTVIFDQPGAVPATVTRVRKGAQFYKARWASATP